jgi:hypothetical protein
MPSLLLNENVDNHAFPVEKYYQKNLSATVFTVFLHSQKQG